jgi:hypothetical protein
MILRSSKKRKKMLINEKNVRKRVPVYIRFGKNAGRVAGYIIFEDLKLPYYYVEKKWKAGQIYLAPKHKNTLSISEHIIQECQKHGVVNIVFLIVGMEDKSFYYIVPLKKFIEDSERTTYDDAQLRIRINGLTRYYPEQEGIEKFL